MGQPRRSGVVRPSWRRPVRLHPARLQSATAPADATGPGDWTNDPSWRRRQISAYGWPPATTRALEECYARYGRPVLAFLRRYVGPDEAEDVLQRTFVDVWRNADRYDPRRPLSTWVFTIAHHRAVDTLRRHRPSRRTDRRHPRAGRRGRPGRGRAARLGGRGARGPGPAARQPARGARAVVLRRADAGGDRRCAGRAARHGQGEDVARDATAGRAGDEGGRRSRDGPTTTIHGRAAVAADRRARPDPAARGRGAPARLRRTAGPSWSRRRPRTRR